MVDQGSIYDMMQVLIKLHCKKRKVEEWRVEIPEIIIQLKQ